MLLYPFTVLLNNSDVRPITVELVESEISQQASSQYKFTLHPLSTFFTILFDMFSELLFYLEHFFHGSFLRVLEKRLDSFWITSTWLQENTLLLCKLHYENGKKMTIKYFLYNFIFLIYVRICVYKIPYKHIFCNQNIFKQLVIINFIRN